MIGSIDDLVADLGLVTVLKNVYTSIVKSTEFKRWLTKKGVKFGTQKGSHIKIYFNDRQSVLPMHHKDISRGLVEDIKKQLGLK